MDLAALREEYLLAGLAEADLATDPLTQFARWFADAQAAGVHEPNAMTVATVDDDGHPDARVVLLGSIATDKYVEVLSPALGARLYYPPVFIGRGDMSRGGLLLRSAESGVPLDYAPLVPDAPRHGPRPARLEPKAPRPAR